LKATCGVCYRLVVPFGIIGMPLPFLYLYSSNN